MRIEFGGEHYDSWAAVSLRSAQVPDFWGCIIDYRGLNERTEDIGWLALPNYHYVRLS